MRIPSEQLIIKSKSSLEHTINVLDLTANTFLLTYGNTHPYYNLLEDLTKELIQLQHQLEE